jgi:hypothetical protein
VSYNAGQPYPSEPQSDVARDRLSDFFTRGGGYIGTSQSANSFAFLNVAGLLMSPLAPGSDAAGGGIAVWENVGVAGPLTGGLSAPDLLYLPSNITYFSAVPNDASVDGRYLNDTNHLFLAGLWQDRDAAVANAPVIVHGDTTADSRYLGLATNPFSRGDAERSAVVEPDGRVDEVGRGGRPRRPPPHPNFTNCRRPTCSTWPLSRSTGTSSPSRRSPSSRTPPCSISPRPLFADSARPRAASSFGM